MTVTIVGNIVGSNGDYIQTYPSGARHYGTVELREQQPGLIPLLDEHGGERVGEVVFIERVLDTAAIRVVAVSDLDPDELEGAELSMGVTGRAGRREWEIIDGQLDHVALVRRGGVMAGPVTVLADYDVRHAGETLPACGSGVRDLVESAHRCRYEQPRRVHGLPRFTLETRSEIPSYTAIEHGGGGRVLDVR